MRGILQARGFKQSSFSPFDLCVAKLIQSSHSPLSGLLLNDTFSPRNLFRTQGSFRFNFWSHRISINLTSRSRKSSISSSPTKRCQALQKHLSSILSRLQRRFTSTKPSHWKISWNRRGFQISLSRGWTYDCQSCDSHIFSNRNL